MNDMQPQGCVYIYICIYEYDMIGSIYRCIAELSCVEVVLYIVLKFTKVYVL